MHNDMLCAKCKILVIDFGSQYTQLILRRIRELGVYSELYDWNISKSQFIKLNPSGVIFSGSPYSVMRGYNPRIPEFIFKLKVPVLGICYGMQVMVAQLGGMIECSVNSGEFGDAQVEILVPNILVDNIHDRVNNKGNVVLDVWMSHRDIITTVPRDFIVVGVTEYQKIAIIAHKEYHWYGVQFHPEVTHTKKGINILERFVIDICQCTSSWKPMNIINSIIDNIQKSVGNDKVMLAFSGGVDSFVTALLLRYAINNRFICVFIDNGLLCFDEISRIRRFHKQYQDLNIIYLSEKNQFLNALVGIINPEKKRLIVGKIFIKIFQEQISKFKDISWLAQGTIYSDVIESGKLTVGSANVIKSHHNVAGLPDFMEIKLLEPIRSLFKDEVRNIGLKLGLTYDIINRYPFPGPGMAVRILGEVKEEYCNVLRESDCIFVEELNNAKLYNKVSQAFSVFISARSVGIKGDKRQYNWVVALRAVETQDFMTARWARLPYDFLDKVSNRIVNEVAGVSRVVFDISNKPPATIEWE